CLLVISTSGKTVPITFTPAEIQFLFSAPFTRRQLLSYKLINQLLLSLPISVFMGIGLRHVSGSTPQALVSAFLAFTFLQFFALAWNFIAATVGELAFSRTRRAILLFLVLALAWAGGRAMQFKDSTDAPLETLQRIEQSQVLQWIVTPFRWYVRMLTARHFWPDLVQWAAICLAINI